MKYLFTLLAALFLAFAGSAQSVVWCPPGAEWHYYAGPTAQSGYIRLKYDGDTVILGQACKRLVENHKYVNQVTGFLSETLKNRYTYESDSIIYALNESVNPPSWEVLYKFNAQPGDSWPMFGSDGEVTIVVNNNEFDYIGNEMLVRLDVTLWFTDVGQSDVIYERVGILGYKYPFNLSLVPTSQGQYEFCNYSDQNITDWEKSDAVCRQMNYLSQDENNSSLEISVSPNPASDKIYLNFKNSVHQSVVIELRDALGNLVFQDKRSIENLDPEVSLRRYPAGLYFLRVSGQNYQYTTKIVKE